MLAAISSVGFRSISVGLTDAHIRYVEYSLALGVLALSANLSRNMKKDPLLRWGWTDGWVLLWVLWRFGATWFSGKTMPLAQSVSCLADALLYVSLREIFSLRIFNDIRAERMMGMKPIETALVLLLAVFAIKECLLGLFQFFGRAVSHHIRFSITGSFCNPGPYGAWLMVSAAVCGSYAWRMKERFEMACAHMRKTWPFLSYYVLVALAAILSLMLLPASLSRAAWAGLAVAVVVFVLRETDVFCHWKALRCRRPGIAHVMGLLVCMIALAVLVGVYLMKKDSADGRLFMDRISCRIIGRYPLLGCGPGRYAGAYGKAQQDFFENCLNEQFQAADALHEADIAGCPDVAFNEYLSVGTESGLPGLLLMLCIIVSALRRLLNQKNSAFVYGLISVAVFAAFSYPFSLLPFRIWTVVMLALAASADGGVEQKGRLDMSGSLVSVASLLALLILNGVNLSRLRMRVEAERAWLECRAWYSCAHFDAVEDDYDQLANVLIDHPHFLFEYGRLLCMCERYEEALDVLQRGMTYSSDPMFLNVAGNCCKALAVHAVSVVEREKWTILAEQWYRRAFFRLPNRIYSLFLLEKLYFDMGFRDSFDALKPFVLNFTPKVDSPEICRMKSEIENLSLSGGLESR